jgi:hypothetical protein
MVLNMVFNTCLRCLRWTLLLLQMR